MRPAPRYTNGIFLTESGYNASSTGRTEQERAAPSSIARQAPLFAVQVVDYANPRDVRYSSYGPTKWTTPASPSSSTWVASADTNWRSCETTISVPAYYSRASCSDSIDSMSMW